MIGRFCSGRAALRTIPACSRRMREATAGASSASTRAVVTGSAPATRSPTMRHFSRVRLAIQREEKTSGACAIFTAITRATPPAPTRRMRAMRQIRRGGCRGKHELRSGLLHVRVIGRMGFSWICRVLLSHPGACNWSQNPEGPRPRFAGGQAAHHDESHP